MIGKFIINSEIKRQRSWEKLKSRLKNTESIKLVSSFLENMYKNVNPRLIPFSKEASPPEKQFEIILKTIS
jgi:hypothetical protein